MSASRELVQTCADIGETKEVISREDSNGNQTGSAFILYKWLRDANTAAHYTEIEHLRFKSPTFQQIAELLELKQAEEPCKLFQDVYKILTLAKKQQPLASLRKDCREMSTLSSPFAANYQPQSSTNSTAPAPVYPPVSSTPEVRKSVPNNMYKEVPRLYTFSGTVGKEAPFSRWHYELMCLVRENYPDTTIMSAIRKFLRSPAADVLRRLGDDAGPDQVLRKF